MDLVSAFQTMSVELTQMGPADALTVATLAILEGILSVDNALVLAILVRQLPKEQQARALLYGLAGAFFFRFVALLFAAQLMEYVFFKLVGGGYLLYLAMKHLFFYKEEAYHQAKEGSTSFWRTVLVVELTDVAFSIDSITAAVAMSDKLVIVWMGGILGILCLRFSSRFFMWLLEKLPRLEDLAYQIIFFVGTKLTLEGFHVEIAHNYFWMIMGIITLLGSSLVYRDYHQRKAHRSYDDDLLDRAKRGELTMEELQKLPRVPPELVAYFVNKGCLTLPAAEEKA